MNTKYMNGQFVRNVATVLVAVTIGAFWACSNDESTLGGGVSEETRVMALDDITITGKAMMLRGMTIPENDSAEAEIEPEMVYDKADLVTVYELDSVTFEKTGVEYNSTVYDHEGSFEMEKVSFKSPYVLVMVEKLEGCGNNEVQLCGSKTETVANLNKTKNVNVNVLTTLAAKRTLKLAATGIGLDSAKSQAEREVLESFYIYEKHTPFDELSFASKSDKSYPIFIMANNLFSDYMGKFLNDFAEDLAIDGVWNGTYISNSNQMLNLDLADKALIPYENGLLSRKNVLEVYGLDSSDNSIVEKALAFLTNFNAMTNDSLERCDESKQGEISMKTYWPVKCESGLWGPVGELPHEFGSLIDERDGKVYKTVIIETDGVKQTWMAENLNFADSLLGDSWCYDNNSKNCETSGRLYSWNAALNTSENMEEVVSGEKKFAPVSQGICPDGWRLPTLEDWYVVLPDRSAFTLGFNGKMKNPDEWYRAVAALKSSSWPVEKRGMIGHDLYGFAALPAGTCEVDSLDGETGLVCSRMGTYTSFAIGGITNGMVALRSDRSLAYYLKWGYEAVSVRCIKND